MHSASSNTSKSSCKYLKCCGLFLVLFSLGSAGQPLPEVTIDTPETPPGDASLESSGFSQTVPLDSVASEPLVMAVTQHPAVVNTPRGKSASPQFSLRGMDPLQTRFFLEGIPLTEPAFNTSAVGLIPALGSGEVEVYPGEVPEHLPGTSLSGAINIRIPSSRFPQNFLSRVGSFKWLEIAASSRLSEQGRIALGFSQSQENFNYLDDNGTPFNTSDDQKKERIHNGFRRLSLLPSWQTQIGNNSLKIFSLNSLQWVEVPGATYQPEYFDLTEYHQVSAIKYQRDLSPLVSIQSDLFLRMAVDQLKESELASTTQTREFSARSTNSTWGGQGAVIFKSEPITATVRSSVFISKLEQNAASTRLLEVPFSLLFQVPISSEFEIKPACLAHWTESDDQNQALRGWNFSPRLGWQLQSDNFWRLRGAVGSYFRRPQLTELFGNQKGLSGNVRLNPERAHRAEIGWDWLGNPHWSITVFGTQAQDLIQYLPSGSNAQRPENIGAASWWGQELSAEWIVSKELSFRPVFASLFSRNNSEVVAEKNKILPNRFPWFSRLDTTWEKQKWRLGHRASFFSNSFLDRANLKELAPFQIHDITISRSDRAWGQFAMEIQNLFDITVANGMWSGVESLQTIGGIPGYPIAGRRVYFTWTYII